MLRKNGRWGPPNLGPVHASGLNRNSGDVFICQGLRTDCGVEFIMAKYFKQLITTVFVINPFYQPVKSLYVCFIHQDM